MISKYFSYQYNFNDIVDNDPVKTGVRSEFWYLKSQTRPPWSYNSNIFTDKEIERIVVIGKRLNPERAATGDEGVDCLDYRRSFVSWIGSNSQTSWIFQKLTDAIIATNDQFWNFDLKKIEKLQFTYYSSEEKGTYHAHVDPINWSIPHNRKLSMSLQLSDPNDYEGGDLVIHTGISETLPKQKGMAIFFPSYTLHEVIPVTKGERYSLVAWVHGPNLR
jgi:PKHD-type hydroxylase